MARQAGMRVKDEKASAAVSVEDLLKRCNLPPAAKRMMRDALRHLGADLKAAQSRRAAALASATEAETRYTAAAAELGRLREIQASMAKSLDAARASQAATQAARDALQRDLDAARLAQADAQADYVRLRQELDAARSHADACCELEGLHTSAAAAPLDIPAPAPIRTVSLSALAAAKAKPTFAEPEPFRARKPVPTPERVESQPPPLRPTPPQPEAAQAAPGRGRVDTTTTVGALLIKAPPAPGGYAGQCFAVLLDRSCIHLPRATDDDMEGERRDHRAEDDLTALAHLYRSETRFYPNVTLRQSDGLPLNGDLMRAAMTPQRGSSPAAACIEEAHG